MRDRLNPCIYYICANAECEKHFKDVTMKKCQTCSKYMPRKVAKKKESIASRKAKDKDRHDNWKNW